MIASSITQEPIQHTDFQGCFHIPSCNTHSCLAVIKTYGQKVVPMIRPRPKEKWCTTAEQLGKDARDFFPNSEYHLETKQVDIQLKLVSQDEWIELHLQVQHQHLEDDKVVYLGACVDCGWLTGQFCDYCLAAKRLPSEKWAKDQHTPLCSPCENDRGCCRFCREA